MCSQNKTIKKMKHENNKTIGQLNIELKNILINTYTYTHTPMQTHFFSLKAYVNVYVFGGFITEFSFIICNTNRRVFV